jgi:hypothetical protein
MEQQTISVAKAGIQATLNARAAILAAANPLGGRYDRSKPLKYNVNLPPAILSRFDLLHVMVDEVNPAVDEAIAYHILASHRDACRAPGEQVGENFPANSPPFTQLKMQQYIRYARALKPKLTAAVRPFCAPCFSRSCVTQIGHKSALNIPVIYIACSGCLISPQPSQYRLQPSMQDLHAALWSSEHLHSEALVQRVFPFHAGSHQVGGSVQGPPRERCGAWQQQCVSNHCAAA